jgi:hypothetical protein
MSPFFLAGQIKAIGVILAAPRIPILIAFTLFFSTVANGIWINLSIDGPM